MDIRSLLIVALSVFAIAGSFHVFVLPHLSGQARAAKRHARIASRSGVHRGGERAIEAAARRKQVAESLKELEQRNAEKAKVTLEARIARAGLNLTRTNFLVASGLVAILTALLLFVVTSSILAGLAGLVIGGFGLPNFWLKFQTDSRLKKFILEFPNAIDIIVRGVKAGLPLNECVRIIASESAEPLRTEFRQIVEAQTLGLSTSEAIERMTLRIPTAEANFFAIAIAVQQKSGGNLAEVLTNLSRVLRERKKMRDKVRAISSEAKSSAAIIGALPLVVTLLIYLSSPHYIELLWTTDLGRAVLAVCVLFMGIGVFIMKKMIAFDI